MMAPGIVSLEGEGLTPFSLFLFPNGFLNCGFRQGMSFNRIESMFFRHGMSPHSSAQALPRV
jgi:hypothetical protein